LRLSCSHNTPAEAIPLDGYKGGWIEIIAGGMFSGKSEELIRRLRRAVIARQRVQVFKPHIDDRYGPEDIVSRDDRRLKAGAAPLTIRSAWPAATGRSKLTTHRTERAAARASRRTGRSRRSSRTCS